jgi:hypothetical protein
MPAFSLSYSQTLAVTIHFVVFDGLYGNTGQKDAIPTPQKPLQIAISAIDIVPDFAIMTSDSSDSRNILILS